VIRCSPVRVTASTEMPSGGGGNARSKNRPIIPAESTNRPATSPTATAQTTAAQCSISAPETTN
jgi:hypothetical protein